MILFYPGDCFGKTALLTGSKERNGLIYLEVTNKDSRWQDKLELGINKDEAKTLISILTSNVERMQ